MISDQPIRLPGPASLPAPGRPARGRGPHGSLQLALRALCRRRVGLEIRRHRCRALHQGVGGRAPRRLKWLGLDWDEGPEVGGPYEPYRQSERIDTYRYIAERLETDGKAFKCYCTDEEFRRKRDLAIQEGKPAIYDGKSENSHAYDERCRLEGEGRSLLRDSQSSTTKCFTRT